MADSKSDIKKIGECIVQGETQYNENKIRFIYEDKEKTVRLLCIDIGNVFSSPSLKRGSTDFEEFLFGKTKKKFFSVPALKRIFSNPSSSNTKKEEKKIFLEWVERIFFGDGEKKFTISADGRKVSVYIIGQHVDVFVDSNKPLSLESACCQNPELEEKLRFIVSATTKIPDSLGEASRPDPDASLKKEGKGGFVYILRDIAGEEGVYKVGKAEDLKSRKSSYSCGSSKEPVFERVFETDDCSLFEKCMHHVFSPVRRGRTEMFDAPLEALEIVGDLVRILDELKKINEEALSRPFSEKKYIDKCEKVLLERHLFKRSKERQEHHERRASEKLEKLKKVKEHVEKNGSFPNKNNNSSLAEFLKNFRYQYRQKKSLNFTKELVSFAESIPGWSWDPTEEVFDRLCTELTLWLSEHKKPLVRKLNVRLYDNLNSWKKSYRVSEKNKEHELEELVRIHESFGLAFHPNPLEDAFIQKTDELREYVKEHKKLPPAADDCPLGMWLSDVRKKFVSKGRMCPANKQILDSIHPSWCQNQNGCAWEKTLEEHVAFYALHGHFNSKDKGWLKNQRTHLKAGNPPKRDNARLVYEQRRDCLNKRLPGWDTVKPGVNSSRNCEVCLSLKNSNAETD
ncbi:hypothetical protein D1R32_gp406 [Tunisvirus fontaine2]|uniref:Bacteriophage T5 Orf172 DNA-binding domain-containing protein n=1 Tax=Tunisvirus fontaine2 TaxID=1421067 RepID=V9SDZ9_9VIRU|nr:hypothetical protein D1R32_gp406 [Tunisvirus fontaine2]AHC55123.1 hypothetical protein TNS_ORF405 [Tunisvirus fontaine2]